VGSLAAKNERKKNKKNIGGAAKESEGLEGQNIGDASRVLPYYPTPPTSLLLNAFPLLSLWRIEI
jgi:hypothetical protein